MTHRMPCRKRLPDLPPPRLLGATFAAMFAAMLVGMPPAAGQTDHKTDSATATRRQQTAVQHVGDAVGVAQAMGSDAGMSALLGRAHGVFIIPKYGRAALGIGGAGGAGVLMVRHENGTWGNPAFFDTGGLSIGLQAGAEGGPVALVLLNQKAVDSFRNRNNFSLNADAGLTVVNFARMAQGSTAGDIVAWSGTKGLFGNAATVGINDIRYNQGLTEAYYGKPTTAKQAIDSTDINTQADALRKALGSAPAPAPAGSK